MLKLCAAARGSLRRGLLRKRGRHGRIIHQLLQEALRPRAVDRLQLMMRVPPSLSPACSQRIHGHNAAAMLGQCPSYEAIERLQIVDAVASHRCFGEYREQPLGQVSQHLLALLRGGWLARQHRLERRRT
eukprot:572227-Pyramimonas_sp.AAC.1